MSELPDFVDEDLWFWSERCAGRDYLYDSRWHTHPGRMAVYCPHDPIHSGYRISKSELPSELPMATRYFVAGFLAGNLPPRPSEDGDPSGSTLKEWTRAAERFATDGVWHVEADLEEPWRRTEAQFVNDAAVLGEIGRAIEDQIRPVAVTIPTELAAAAVGAWHRTDHVYVADPLQLARVWAATLAYIGKAIEDGGGASQRSVTLDARMLGDALNASDEYEDGPNG